jgi:hypothetical protein
MKSVDNDCLTANSTLQTANYFHCSVLQRYDVGVPFGGTVRRFIFEIVISNE